MTTKLAVFLCLLFGCGTDHQGRVSKLEWNHITELRERAERRSGDWNDPPMYRGAYQGRTFNYNCYDRENGTTCLNRDKDFNCTLAVPDYDRWCDYSWYDWPVIDSRVVVGEGVPGSWAEWFDRVDHNHRPYYKAVYHVTFENHGKTWTWSTDEHQSYARFHLGDIWKVHESHFGRLEPIGIVPMEK